MIDNRKTINISLTGEGVFKALLVFVFFVFAYLLLDLLLIILTSIVIASAVEPATRWFTDRRIPRVLGVLAVYAVSFLMIFSFLYIFIPSLFLELSDLATDLPQKLDSLDILDSQTLPFYDLTTDLSPTLSLENALVEAKNSLASFVSGGTFATASAVFGGVSSFVLILVLSFYLAVQEKGIDSLIRIITPIQHEPYVIGLWRRTQYKIGSWVKGQILLSLLIGVLVFLGLTILRIRYAFVLAILAASLELIPIFGPIIAAVPAIMIALADGGLTVGLMVVGLYIIIQQFENHLIYPLVVKKIVGVPPIISIVSLIIGGKLFGFLGFILAVPLAAVIMELAADTEKKKLAALKAKKSSSDN